jgi:hypothetical protein
MASAKEHALRNPEAILEADGVAEFSTPTLVQAHHQNRRTLDAGNLLKKEAIVRIHDLGTDGCTTTFRRHSEMSDVIVCLEPVWLGRVVNANCAV